MSYTILAKSSDGELQIKDVGENEIKVGVNDKMNSLSSIKISKTYGGGSVSISLNNLEGNEWFLKIYYDGDLYGQGQYKYELLRIDNGHAIQVKSGVLSFSNI